ncbi:DUF222 domain-containing protein [Kribbella sp. NPDC051770]|uniref:DUF222 domain-containing protein n=1 Tax=Kribbella sp. NPDC051770 TaxID=3155413 RepID=UPI00343BF516
MTYCDERPPWSMAGSEMLLALDDVQACVDRLQSYRLRLLAALDAGGHAAEIGARDTVQLIAVRHRLDPIEVRRDLRLATALPRYAEVAAALHRRAADEAGALRRAVRQPVPLPADTPDASGTPDASDAPGAVTLVDQLATPAGLFAGGTAVSPPDLGAASTELQASAGAEPCTEAPVLRPAQAEAIVTALERIPSTAQIPVEDLQVAERELVKAAQVLCPAELRKLGKRVRDTLDTDGPEPAEHRALAAETLWLKRGDQGTEFGGYLAGDNAELLHTLIFAGAKPHQTADGARDPRSRGKRQADALTAVLTTAAATGAAAPAHGDIKPHVTVTVDLNDLSASTGVGTLASGATLSTGAIRRLACDAGVIPLVLGSTSEPLDVGTEHRFVTRAIRHTLNARDKGCVICQAPPAMCEAHHVTHWANGGPTALTNLALLCKAHHIDVHQGHWTITVDQGHPTVTRPTWATPNQPP